MVTSLDYEIDYCKIHLKHIYFFKKDIIFKGFHCWDCIRESNQKKSKQEQKLLEAKSQFAIDFSHLWMGNLVGGIIAVKIKEHGLTVEIESSSEATQQVPDSYQGFHIVKEIVGGQ